MEKQERILNILKYLGQMIIKDTEDKWKAKVSILGDWNLSSSAERNGGVRRGQWVPLISLGYDKFEVMTGSTKHKSPQAAVITKGKTENKNPS